MANASMAFSWFTGACWRPAAPRTSNLASEAEFILFFQNGHADRGLQPKVEKRWSSRPSEHLDLLRLEGGLDVLTAQWGNIFRTLVLHKRIQIGSEDVGELGKLHRWFLTEPKAGPADLRTHQLMVSPGNSGAVMKYGFPSLANIKSRESYVTSYDPRTRTASWVIERLDPASLKGPSDRKFCEFKEDDSIHIFHRATNADYRGSGFDRGHLAAAANHKWSQKAMEDTFYLSNVAPQNPNLNQNTWNNLEKLCRSLTKHYLNVYVCTGPLYLPRQEDDGKLYVKYQVIGRNHVAVPTHFFKVLILEQTDGKGVELRSYVLPNEPIDEKVPLERFLVPIETIERASGLLFVPNIMRRTGKLQAISNK